MCHRKRSASASAVAPLMVSMRFTDFSKILVYGGSAKFTDEKFAHEMDYQSAQNVRKGTEEYLGYSILWKAFGLTDIFLISVEKTTSR